MKVGAKIAKAVATLSLIGLSLLLSIVQEKAFSRHILKDYVPTKPLPEAAISEVYEFVEKEHYREALIILGSVVNAYLGGMPINGKAIDVEVIADDLFPARLEGATIYIDEKIFKRSVRRNIYEANEIARAKTIVLFHELVHRWQDFNIQNDSHCRIEGHAMFMQLLFAKDYNLDEINQKGIDAFDSVLKLRSITNRNVFTSMLLKVFIKTLHFRGYKKMIKRFNETNIGDPLVRIRAASSAFFRENLPP